MYILICCISYFFRKASNSADLEFIGTIIAVLFSLIAAAITIFFTNYHVSEQIKATHEDTKYQIEENKKNEIATIKYNEQIKDIKYCVVQLSQARIYSSNIKSSMDELFDKLDLDASVKSSEPYITINVLKIRNIIVDYYNHIVTSVNNIYAYCKLLDLSNKDTHKLVYILQRTRSMNPLLNHYISLIQYHTNKKTVTDTYQMYKDSMKNYKHIEKLGYMYTVNITHLINDFIDIKGRLLKNKS